LRSVKARVVVVVVFARLELSFFSLTHFLMCATSSALASTAQQAHKKQLYNELL
jgi:hypothetical protein